MYTMMTERIAAERVQDTHDRAARARQVRALRRPARQVATGTRAGGTPPPTRNRLLAVFTRASSRLFRHTVPERAPELGQWGHAVD